MVRREDLREELELHRNFLAGAPRPETQSGRFMRAQLEQRIESLQEEILIAETPRLGVRFAGPITVRNSMPTRLLADLLNRFQRTLDRSAWAKFAGPGVEGDVPARFARAAATEVSAFSPGSFVVALSKVPDVTADQDQMLDSPTLFADVIESILRLAKSAADGPLGEADEEIIEGLGRSATRDLKAFVQRLADTDTTLEVRWSEAEPRQVVLEPVRSAELVSWLSEVQTQLQEMIVVGRLHLIDTLGGHFGIEDDAGNVIQGKAVPELLEGTTEGARYAARIQVNERVAPRTGNVRSTNTLLSLEARASSD